MYHYRFDLNVLMSPKGFTASTYINGRKVLVTSDGKKSVTITEMEQDNKNIVVVAKCHPEDVFHIDEGLKLAFERYSEAVNKREAEEKVLHYGDIIRFDKNFEQESLGEYSFETASKICVKLAEFAYENSDSHGPKGTFVYNFLNRLGYNMPAPEFQDYIYMGTHPVFIFSLVKGKVDGRIYIVKPRQLSNAMKV